MKCKIQTPVSKFISFFFKEKEIIDNQIYVTEGTVSIFKIILLSTISIFALLLMIMFIPIITLIIFTILFLSHSLYRLFDNI